MLSDKIVYADLNSRQKEIYNFQKVSAIFADYGYTTIKLSDDWLGADFIAISFDGNESLKVQLKSRLTFSKKYLGKNIFICFQDRKKGIWYLYPHDTLLKKYIGKFTKTKSWNDKDGYTYPTISKETDGFLAKYRIN